MKRLKLLIFSLLLLSPLVFSKITMEQLSYTVPSSVPLGTQRFVAGYFQIKPSGVPTGNSEIWQSYTIENQGTVTLNDITFYFYLDDDQDGIFEPNTDSKIKDTLTYSTSNSIITIDSIAQYVTSNTTLNYFVVFDLAASANYGNAVLKFKLLNAVSTGDGLYSYVTQNLVIISDNVSLTKNYNVSALKSGYTISPTINIHRTATSTGIFGFDMKTYSNLNLEPSINISIQSSVSTNLGYISIYEDQAPLLTLDGNDNFISSHDITTNRTVLFEITKNYKVGTALSRNYLIAFAPNEEPAAGTTINFTVTEITAIGAQSGNFPHTVYDPLPSFNVNIAGLEINVSASTPTYVDISANMEISVFQLSLKSYFTQSTLNSLTLVANGDILFSNTSTKNIIQSVYIYNDTDGSKSFNAADTKLLTINVGSYTFISADAIIATINRIIPRYLTAANEEMFFINYLLTNNVQENTSFRTWIDNGSYTTSINSTLHNLRSALQTSTVNIIYVSERGKILLFSQPYSFPSAFAPQGSINNVAYYLGVKQVGQPTFNNVIWDSITFENRGSINITEFELNIVSDIDNNGILDDTDVELTGLSTSTSGNYLTLSNVHQYIPWTTDTNTKNYFIVANFVASANYGTNNFNIIPTDLESTSIDDDTQALAPYEGGLSGNIYQRYFSLTGLNLSYTITNNSILFNDNNKLPIFFFNVKPHREGALPLSIEILVQSNSDNNLGELQLYKDIAPLLSFSNDTFISSFNITNSSDITFSYPTADILNNASHNFSIIYKPDKYLEAGASINIIFQRVYGLGQLSSQEMNVYDTIPSKNIFMGGIQIRVSQNVQDSVFIGNMEIPMNKYTIRSYFTTTTLNHLKLVNDGTIIYSNSLSDQNRIEKVLIYENTNSHNYWDNTDSQIASENRGTYIFTSSTQNEIIVTLNSEFSTYNTTEQTFYINYKLAQNTEAFKSALLKISDLEFSDRLYNKTHSLLYPLESYTVVTANTGTANIYISTYNYLAPSFSIQGEQNVALIKFSLRALEYVPSFSILISNNLSLFTGNDFGIKQISIFEDKNSNKKLDLNDILHDHKSNFNSQDRTTVTIQDLDNLYQEYHFLIMANFGSNIPTSQYSTDYLKLQFDKQLPSTNNTVAALLPMPNPPEEIILTPHSLYFEILNVTPNVLLRTTSPQIWIDFKIQNQYPATLTISEVYPQFYKELIGSLNISYYYNLTSTQNFPVTLAPTAIITISYTVTPNDTFEADDIYVDGYAKYSVFNKTINFQRSKLYTWESSVSGNKVTPIRLPTIDIFFLEYPEYIEKVERESLGTTSNFRNGEIIEAGDYLSIYFVRNGTEVDLFSTQVMLNETTLSAFSSPYTRMDTSEGIIKIGPINDTEGTIKLQPYDKAGNPYPEAAISFITNTNLSISNFLVYPSRLDQTLVAADPLRIGFLLSKPAETWIYLFNSIGECIWKSNQTYTEYGYKLQTFNGTLISGELIPRGIYIIKIVAKDLDNNKYEKSTTKFIVN